MPVSTAAEECMLLCCSDLSKRIHQDDVYEGVTKHAVKLYDLQQKWCDDLLAVWAESSLPAGFIPSTQCAIKSVSTAVTRTGAAAIIDLGKRVIQDKIRSAGTARLLSIAVYRSSAVWRAYSASTPSLLESPDTTAACIAYLEISSLPSSAKPDSAILEAMIGPGSEALLHHNSSVIQEHVRQILVQVAKVDKTVVPALLAKLQTIFSQEALSDAPRLCADNLVFLRALHREVATFESFSALETFINTSLLWVVRRFAEDDHNDDVTSRLVRATSKSFAKNISSLERNTECRFPQRNA